MATPVTIREQKLQKLLERVDKSHMVDLLPMPELVRFATGKRHSENRKKKHDMDAKYGWYRYDVRFAIPVYSDQTGMIARYNIYKAVMLVRHAEDDHKYLYDFVELKKETSSPPRSEDRTV
jgi:hypothetical protein